MVDNQAKIPKEIQIEKGSPTPLGVSQMHAGGVSQMNAGGVSQMHASGVSQINAGLNFSLFSRHADLVTLLLSRLGQTKLSWNFL